jgi:hypothetical protein
MKWYTYDVEVFAHDFIVVFKDKQTGEYTVFHNNNEGVRDFISPDAIYCGFNSKNYDQYIIKAICGGLTPEEIKEINDWMIADNQGWEHPLLQGVYYTFNNVDIRNDVYIGLSLKTIEGHLGMNIQETEVDFDLKRPLTPDEIEQTIRYCKHDVDATEELTRIRKDYLVTKQNLGARAGIDSVKALSLTNAKLTAKMLGAVRVERNDGREYVYPPNLDLSLVPQKILEFFETIHDKSIPDEVLFKTHLKTTIGGMPCKYAWGGVHGSLTGYYEESTETRVVQNRDVSSLYPSLIEEYKYLSRNVPDPQLFYDIRKDRIKAKHTGDKQTATDLKLPLNTVSGAQENKYNDLYDPLPTRSLRISGQLFLTVLATDLLRQCKSIKLLNLNTDGLMYSVDKDELPLVDKICSEWEKTTRFELETDDISKVWIKDVNNLLLIKTNGKVKTVGGYLNHGISVKGAWSINNNMVIVKKALIEYFVNGTPVETTINNSTDVFDFQIIAQAGKKFKEAYHIVAGEKQPVQKVNRVYATKDKRYGKLVKVHAEKDSETTAVALLEHCIIDNENKLTIDDIDKTFYINLAKRRINDFLGIKPENNKGGKRNMAETQQKPKTETKGKEMNVYQKLLKARIEFMNDGVQKSGKNMHLAFKYYELDDIVPVANRIFDKLGLLPVVSFSNEMAMMKIIDTSNPESNVDFFAPLVVIAENKGTNAVQAMGASITYYRRYLYMMALDICEADEIDNKPSANIPVTTPEQTEKKSLTDSDSNATELQLKQLKEALKQVLESDPSKEEWVAQIAVDTQGFTVISKADCEKLMLEIKGGK